MGHDPSDAKEFISGGGLANPTKTYKDMDDKREEEAKKKAKKAEQRAKEKAEQREQERKEQQRTQERQKEKAKDNTEERKRKNAAGGSAATILTGAGGLQADSGSNKRTLMGS